MMPKMKREQFEEMSFEELLEWAYENIDDIYSEEVLIEMAKHEIDEDNIKMALHILNAIYESEAPDGTYYIYDRCMGTLETPTPIIWKEHLEEYIDFEEDEEDEEEREEAKMEEFLIWEDRFSGKVSGFPGEERE